MQTSDYSPEFFGLIILVGGFTEVSQSALEQHKDEVARRIPRRSAIGRHDESAGTTAPARPKQARV